MRRCRVFNFRIFVSPLQLVFGKISLGIMLRSGKVFLGLVWKKHLTKEGPMPLIPSSRMNAASVSIIKRSMMQTDSLPLADVIDDQRWQQLHADKLEAVLLYAASN